MPDSVMHKPSSVAEKLLGALQLPRVGTATLRQLAQKIEEAPDADVVGLLAEWFPRIPAPSATDLDLATSSASRLVESCAEHGIGILSILDSDYPRQLAGIKDAPPLLYVKGDIAAFGPLSFAIVGTREASEGGRRLAHRIASIAVKHGFVVTSGLARGIDTAAHRGALSEGGRTVAVLAHGLDKVTPASNRDLADELVDAGGALVSEHAPGVPPRPAEYVRRNRIQCGLSVASIMVESGEEGGSIHQARFTREQGRDLYAVLPNDVSKEWGFNESGGKLLVDTMEAVPLRSSSDFLAALAKYGEAERGDVESTERVSGGVDDGKQLGFRW
jgi:DNA processing protein